MLLYTIKLRTAVNLLVIAACAILSSCSMITKTAVNKKFPTRSLDQIRVNNLEEQTLQIERLVRADVAVHLAANDMDSVFDANLKLWFDGGQNFNIPEIQRVTLKEHKLSFEKQAIRIDMLVDIEPKKDQPPGRIIKSSTWKLQALVSPRSGDSTLHLTTSILNVKVERLKLRGIFRLLWVIKPVFNKLAISMRDNINGYLEKHPIDIPLKINPLSQVPIREIVSSSQLAIVGDPRINYNKVLGPVAIRVDESGIDLVAQMIDAKSTDIQSRLSATVQEITTDHHIPKPLKKELFLTAYHCKKALDQVIDRQPYFNTASQYASSTAQLSNGKLNKSDIPVYSYITQAPPSLEAASLSKTGLGRRKKAKQRLRLEAPTAERRHGLNELFDRYTELFHAKMLTTLDSFNVEGKTEVQISKQFLTAVFNEVFADPNIVFTYQQDFNFVQPPVSIELLDKPNFTCSSVLVNCNDRLRNCKGVLSNCGSCSRWNFFCKAKQAVCHVGNGIKWAACQVGNGATYAACQVENAGKFLWCSTVFLVEYALFEALKVGTYAARGDVHVDGQFSLLQANLGENLQNYKLTTNAVANGDFDVHLLFDGAGLVEWLLCRSIDCRLNDGFRVSQVNPTINGEIKVNHIPGNGDQLVIQVPEIKVRLELDNPLIKSLITQCPGMFVSCKISRILLFSFGLYLIDNPTFRNYLDTLWKGRYDHNIEPFDVTLDIPPMQLPGKWGSAHAAIQNRSVSLRFNQ